MGKNKRLQDILVEQGFTWIKSSEEWRKLNPEYETKPAPKPVLK